MSYKDLDKLIKKPIYFKKTWNVDWEYKLAKVIKSFINLFKKKGETK
jgi:hypothetical protein